MTTPTASPTVEVELPPLPPVDARMVAPYESLFYLPGYYIGYVEEYARAFARTAVLQERERCAKLVEAQRFYEVVPELAADPDCAGLMGDMLNFKMYGPVAAAIRKG